MKVVVKIVVLLIVADWYSLAQAGELAKVGASGNATCSGSVYLTIDTGHMEPAEEIAGILKKHDVKATFFLANEKTKLGPMSLDPAWSAFWKARVAEGHAFGAKSGQTLNQSQVCAEIRQSETAFKRMTGRSFDGIWRAPGGKLTPNTIRFAEACGYKHVEWSPAGFSGDELPSEKFPSDNLIKKQLRDIKEGDILLWHLGIWSRKEPLYPKLETLIAGIKAKGLCFARITDNPRWKK